MADDKPIIIIKKKGGHGGHHGGAWKVAYADFVTAMMAFFMVMWLVNSAEQSTKQNIASYFRKPGIFESGSGTPLMVGEAGILTDGFVPPHPEDTKQLHSGKSKEQLKGKSGTDSDTLGSKRVTYLGDKGKKDSVPDEDVAQRGFLTEEANDPVAAREAGFHHEKDIATQAMSAAIEAAQREASRSLEEAAKQLKEQVLSMPGIEQLLGAVEVKISSDGLLLEIMDTEKSSMFQSGSARILPEAEAAFRKISDVLNKLPNPIDIVGHTDGKPFSSRPGGYSNWELSADRANSARRILDQNGITSSRIENVIGRADKELKLAAKPEAASNRRITVKVKIDQSAIEAKAKEAAAKVLAETPSRAEGAATAEETEQSSPGALQETEQIGGAPLRDNAVTGREEAPPTLDPDAIAEKVQKRRRAERVKLPDEEPRRENPTPRSPPTIFRDSPVLGPPDPFANLN